MDKSQLIATIQDVLTQVRPYLQADGGNVEFVELTDDLTVRVRLLGHCADCPHSTATLKNGIESSLKSVLPEIKCVEKVK